MFLPIAGTSSKSFSVIFGSVVLSNRYFVFDDSLVDLFGKLSLPTPCLFFDYSGITEAPRAYAVPVL